MTIRPIIDSEPTKPRQPPGFKVGVGVQVTTEEASNLITRLWRFITRPFRR